LVFLNKKKKEDKVKKEIGAGLTTCDERQLCSFQE